MSLMVRRDSIAGRPCAIRFIRRPFCFRQAIEFMERMWVRGVPHLVRYNVSLRVLNEGPYTDFVGDFFVLLNPSTRLLRRDSLFFEGKAILFQASVRWGVATRTRTICGYAGRSVK